MGLGDHEVRRHDRDTFTHACAKDRRHPLVIGVREVG
jgi:hypothetical protein